MSHTDVHGTKERYSVCLSIIRFHGIKIIVIILNASETELFTEIQ